MINKYKLISHTVLVVFFLLSTIQTLLDIQISFGENLSFATFIISVIASVIPIIIIFSLTNFIKNKTKYNNLFVISEIKSIIKIMFYITLFLVFIIWSIILVSIIIVIYNKDITLMNFISFIVIRVIYSAIYSFIISLFFNSISKPGFRIKKDELSGS